MGSFQGITVDWISAEHVSGIIRAHFARANNIITNLPNERELEVEVGRIYFAIFDDSYTISFLIRDCRNALKVSGRNGFPEFTPYSKMLANLLFSCLLDN